MGCKGSLDDVEVSTWKDTVKLTEEDKAIIKLKKTERMLKKVEERLGLEVDEHFAKAKELKD